MKRRDYNRDILERCVEFLQSSDPSEINHGVVLACYLIEQAIKSELRRITPLLYFDRRNISDEMEIRAATGKLSAEDTKRMKTSTAKRAITQIFEHRSKLRPHKANLEELFEMRNIITHSLDDIPFSQTSVAETAVSALRACMDLIIKDCGISATEFNPLTSREFQQLEESNRKKRISDLTKFMMDHRKVFESLSASEVAARINTNRPKIDDLTWIEETIECPACGQLSLDKIGYVDVDWNPDGTIMSGGYRYQCRVCELDLSEYEYEIVESL